MVRAIELGSREVQRRVSRLQSDGARGGGNLLAQVVMGGDRCECRDGECERQRAQGVQARTTTFGRRETAKDEGDGDLGGSDAILPAGGGLRELMERWVCLSRDSWHIRY